MVIIKLEVETIKAALGNGASNYQLYVGRRITETGTVFTDQEYAQLHPDHVETLTRALEKGFISITSSGFGISNAVTETKELDEIVEASGFGFFIPLAQKGVPNGVATLDALGKVPRTQLPYAALNYKGTWNALTNFPLLGNGGAGGLEGDYYVVGVSGNTLIDGEDDWRSSDWIVNNGTIWQKVDNTQFNDDNITITGGKNNPNVTNSYLYDCDSTPFNLNPTVLPFNAELISISASTSVNETWIAEVHSAVGVLIPGAFINIVNTRKATFLTSIPLLKDSEILLYCNGIQISRPKITINLRRY